MSMSKQATFALTRIDIKRSDAIDQIKISYSDGTTWQCGHDGGKSDARAAVMTEGEYIVRVTHERFENFKSAGAGVEFETSKGRVFEYWPNLSSCRADEQTTLRAKPGHEIVSLDIQKGVLKGIEERVVSADMLTAAAAAANEARVQDGDWSGWHVIVSMAMKEEVENAAEDDSDSDRIVFRHFSSKADAMAAWHGAGRSHRGSKAWANAKAGRASLLLAAHTAVQVHRAGADERAIGACLEASVKRGYCAARAEGSDVSVLETLWTVYRLLSSKRDTWTFVFVVLMLFLDAFFNLQSAIVVGHVLDMFGGSGNATITNVQQSGVVPALVCSMLGCGADNAFDSDADTERSVRTAMLVSFVVVKMLEHGSYVLNVYLHHNACDKRNHKLRIDVFEHVLSLDQSFFDTHTMAEIRGGMNVHAINNLISWNVPYLMARFLKLVLTVYFMAHIDVRMAAMACCSLLVAKYGLLDPLQRRERRFNKVQRKVNIKAEQIVDEAFGMVTSIKLFSKEAQHAHEHAAAQKRYMKSINMTVVFRCVREFGHGVLKTAAFCLVLWQGLLSVQDANLTGADLTAFFLLFNEFQSIFGSIKWHYELLVREFPDIERFLLLMKETSALKNGTEAPRNAGGEIVFDNVHFSYPSRPGEETLKGLSIAIQPGKMTAIVGDSGAGKSTITKLLMRLYDPAAGSISVGGQELRTMDIKQLHDQIAIVPQNPELFNCSMADNIAYGVDGGMADKNAVIEAAKLANCHGFISKFRSGYDTFVGARGAQISAGQKQRIAIARAAMRQPQLMILDEATSSLDVENERVVQEALERVMKGRTTLVIAHRLCTIKNADEIICMKDGRMVERGTHEELIGARGAYYALVRNQLVEQAAPSAERDSTSPTSIASLQRQTSASM